MSSRRIALLLLLLLVVPVLACPERRPPGSERQRPPEQTQPARTPQAPDTPSETSADSQPQTPRLLPEPLGEESRKQTEDTLARAERLLDILADRPLTDPQREERDAGAAFIGQAREALHSGDPDRAIVLTDKALALIENLEQATRP